MEGNKEQRIGLAIGALSVAVLASLPVAFATDNQAFDSMDLATNESFAWVAGSPGVYAYHCHIHPNMTATVVVVAGDGMGVDANVSIQGFMFNPDNVTVQSGMMVRWTNLDAAVHRVMADSGMMMGNGSMGMGHSGSNQTANHSGSNKTPGFDATPAIASFAAAVAASSVYMTRRKR